MHIIAADIGGTKTRFIYADTAVPDTILYEARYTSGDFDSFDPLLKTFIRDSGADNNRIDILTLALPGLVNDRIARLTNLPWTIEKSRLMEDFGIKNVYFMNDFQASAYGASQLPESDRVILYHAETVQSSLEDNAVSVAVGAGTGLGVAWILGDRDRARAYATEGGHIDFAPCNETQVRLLQFLQQRYGHVSYERILSGAGLVSLYEFFASEAGTADSSLNVDAAWVNTQSENDEVANRAVSLFVQIYGAYIGNIALMFKPHGGIYITGGIAAKMLTKMQSREFNMAYLDKGRMRALVEQVTVYLVTNERVGALGAMSHTIKKQQELQ